MLLLLACCGAASRADASVLPPRLQTLPGGLRPGGFQAWMIPLARPTCTQTAAGPNDPITKSPSSRAPLIGSGAKNWAFTDTGAGNYRVWLSSSKRESFEGRAVQVRRFARQPAEHRACHLLLPLSELARRRKGNENFIRLARESDYSIQFVREQELGGRVASGASPEF